MSRILGAYSQYKDSRVEWLGNVPAHWDVVSLRHRYDQRLGKMLDAKRISGEHLRPYLRNVDVQWDRVNVSGLPKMDILVAEFGRYTLKPGDLLVCEGGEVGRSAVWAGDIEVCGYQKALHRLRPHDKGRDSPRFLLHSLRLAASRGAFTDGPKSTIDHLTGEKLRRHRFMFPPLSEQAAIVRFLDHVDRRIRRYIRAKEKLIVLLEEQKQAVARQAVTGQIDAQTSQPYPAYKDSGVEWLPEVPTHWSMRRNVRLFAERHETGFGDLPVLEVSLRTGVQIRDLEDSARKQQMADHGKYKRAERGDIAYNMMRLWQGAIGVVPTDGLVSPAYVVARPLAGVEAAYYDHLFRTDGYKQQVNKNSRGIVSDRNRLYWDAFRRMTSPFPPPEEQQRIVRYLQAASERIDAGAGTARRQIALLRELRTRLIADVVTGKLDIREAATALPEVDPLAAESVP